MGIDSIRAELDRGLAERESATVVVATALEYTPGEPIRVRVRKRGHRYDLST